jgi:DNA-nicking Smr family endonuclease
MSKRDKSENGRKGSKKDQPFNNPFAGIKLKKEEPVQSTSSKSAAMMAPKLAPMPKNKAPQTAEDEEQALFLATVGAVEPVRLGSNKADIKKPPPPPKGSDAEEEALLQLSELVAGIGPFDIVDSDEFIEGSVAGLDQQILRKLRRGDYSIQAHLDLHGLSKIDAKEQVEVFLRASQLKGHRCVLLVHGRGLHSKDQIPVLKGSLETWLSRGRISKSVLAFATAQPHDGGAGAVYVLLRR